MASKIGILTFHCAHNYGAVLQTYATQVLLTEAGYDVEVIDYRPDYLVTPYRIFNLSRFKGKGLVSTLRHVVSEFMLVPVRISRYRAFDNFINGRLRLSDKVTPESFKGGYKAVVIGSDQVWNRNITGGSFDKMYFADFPCADKGMKCIADAVSMETDNLSEGDVKYLRSRAKAFDALSVREAQLASALMSECGVQAVHIQDPVIQVDPRVWEEMAEPSGRRRPYILVYRIRNHGSIDGFVRKLAARLDADVVEVTAFPDGRRLFRARQAVGVEEFLGLLKDASYIVTTSFHAAVFSVIFRRPFTCFEFGGGNDTRQISFLSSVGLQSRMLPLGADVPEELECYFTDAAARLEGLRKESSGFVLDSLAE